MANIISAEIVGTRTAINGSMGYNVNSTDYSVLLFYDNGHVDLIEGDAAQIRPFLQYMHPRNDYKQLTTILNQLEDKLKMDISSLVNKMLLENNNPIPRDITGRKLQDAKTTLENAGFKVILSPVAPDKTQGTVMECRRKVDELMTVILKINYDIPEVIGMNENEAKNTLRSAGFTPVVKMKYYEGIEPGKVMEIKPNPGSMTVDLYVCGQEKRMPPKEEIWR